MRVSAIEERPTAAPTGVAPERLGAALRTAMFDGRRLDASVLRGAAPPGERGPSGVGAPGSDGGHTPGWAGHVDDLGTLVLEEA